jgi:GMP reductase
MAYKLRNFNFEHINLIPRKGIVSSRSECDTSIVLNKMKFKLPVIPANMQCVINTEIAKKLARNGYFYCMHRFDINIPSFIKEMKSENLYASISIGVNEDSYEILNELLKHKLIPQFITIDIAHGHSIKMENMLKYIRVIPAFENTFVIAGNVSTGDAVRELEKLGANGIKVGIAGGAACSTYMETGFGSRGIQASVIDECVKAKINPNTIIIADGGIRENGDIAKSIVLGADLVMAGGMFSGLLDSPGEIIASEDGCTLYKEYWGSASIFQSGKKNRIEGIKKMVPLHTKNILETMKSIEEALQSSISYGGGKKLEDLRNVDYILKNNV